jgi:hypothetical protein
VDLASAHAKVWRLRLSLELAWDAPEQEEQDAAPIGFAPAAIEAPDLGDDDVEDRRLGFVLPP